MVLYVGLGFEKYSNYLTGFGLTLSVYDMLDLELRNTQHKDYLTGLGLILWNTALELINQPSRGVVTKVWRLSWMNCFLNFNIVLIHTAFTALSFGNLYMMISPSTLLRFLCNSGYCMSLTHILISRNQEKNVVLRIYKGFMSGRGVAIIISILFMFWNMSLNSYTRCLTQPPEKPFCYCSVLN